MRNTLSDLIVRTACADPNTYVLSGDHGYALFDAIRHERPKQFINAGVSEQAMIGYASGMMKVGLRTIVYGLSAFVPIRVMEQIKLDLCTTSRPAILLGDGAGLVYTTLGSSHQCAEDISCLRALPNLRIFSPADRFELEACFEEALDSDVPCYIRIGKSDRPEIHTVKPEGTGIHPIHNAGGKIALVGTGSMGFIAQSIARKLNVSAFSVSRIKPWHDLGPLAGFDHLMVIEEHSKYGGLFSSLAELIAENPQVHTKLTSFSLKEQFARKCGGYQYALSEHDMSDAQLLERIQARMKELG